MMALMQDNRYLEILEKHGTTFEPETAFPTRLHVRPAKTQISIRLRAG